MLRYAFRLHRWGMIGYGGVLAIGFYVQGAAFEQAAGSTPASRAAFARGMGALGAQLSYMLPPPNHLDTLAGYLAWRAYGAYPLVLMVWAIAAAAGAVRGDEEKQLVDSWLAEGTSRARVVVSRLAAFAAASLVVTAVGSAFALLGAARVDPLGLGPVAGQTLALWLFAVTVCPTPPLEPGTRSTGWRGCRRSSGTTRPTSSSPEATSTWPASC